jgi:hypothetical protein
MTQMKKSALTILFAACVAGAFSQNASSAKVGLYKNEDDFSVHKLSYEMDCGSKENTIKANNFFESPVVTIQTNQKKYVVSKKDFFGYRDCKGKDYRFYKNQLFEIVDTVAFNVYRHTALEAAAGGKGYKTVTRYYFSKKRDDLIEVLTVKNIEEAFPQNIRFHYAVERYTGNDMGLMDYDPYLKSYKLKYLFLESLK